MQYQSQLKRVTSEVQDSVDVERQLWYGSDLETIKKICKSEFNKDYAGKHSKFLHVLPFPGCNNKY